LLGNADAGMRNCVAGRRNGGEKSRVRSLLLTLTRD
jgi:hypothetical protein